MRILINCLSSVSGGAVSYIRNIAPLLCAHFNVSHDGHRLIFLAHEEQKPLLQSISESQIIWIKGKRPTGLARLLWERLNMTHILRENKIDVLFTPYQAGFLSNGTKHVMMIRNMEPFLCSGYHYSPYNWLRNRLLRIASARSLQNADRVIAVSEFAKDFLVSKIGIDENRISTIYHGRSAGFTPNADPKTDLETIGKIGVGKNFLLTCGSLLPYRRCEDTIAAFNQFAATSNSDAQLVIAGAAIDSRYGRLIRRTIAASPYNNRILAVGHVPQETMAALYRNCLLCILASEIEACPNIAIEAMAAGCVIVSSDCSPLPEIFQGCSLEYHSRNIENLAAQICKGLEDNDLRNNKKMQALKRAEDFSWEKCAGLTYSALVNLKKMQNINMDYTNQKLLFKIKKTLRYIRLYGPRRTYIKIRGQYHMKKRYATLPMSPSPSRNDGHVGLIGCGNFAFSNIAYYLNKNYGRVIRGAMDINIHKAASLFEYYGLQYYTDDADKIIADPAIDLIYIASNHASHAEYAIAALKAGKIVHIEKPHVVSAEQLNRLCAAMADCKGRVRLGFNRPLSRIGLAIKQYLDTQQGPAMFNWFIVGHEIVPEHWYFKQEEGGRILGNLCHWTDLVLQLVPPQNRFPITINPTRGQKSDCDIAVTFTFGDGSIAAITFSAKGHTFEGVRERFTAHRGNVLVSMEDFKNLTVEVVEKKYKTSLLFRDHGHEANIIRSYELSRPPAGTIPQGHQIEYVWDTGNLFLKTRQALEENKKVILQPFDESYIQQRTANHIRRNRQCHCSELKQQ